MTTERTPHRQIKAFLGVGYRVAANLSAMGWQLGDPIPEEYARAVYVSQLGRVHGVLPASIERWISLGWDPTSAIGLRDPDDPSKPLTSANPIVAKQIQRAATAAAWARDKARRAEQRAQEARERIERITPCRDTEELRRRVLDASESAVEHSGYTNAAASAVRAGNVDAFLQVIERRAAEREKRRAVELAEAERRRKEEADKIAASLARLTALEQQAPPPVPPAPLNRKVSFRSAREAKVDRLVFDALKGAIMPLSAITLGRRLKVPAFEVVDALERLAEHVERAGTGPNGATYRVARAV